MKIRKNPKFFEIRRKIKEYKKRLDTLKNQGFRFPKDIYDDIETLEEKISYKPLNDILHHKKIKIYVEIISVFFIIIISLIIISQIHPTMKIIIDDDFFDGMDINREIKIFNITGTTTHSNGIVSSFKIQIDNTSWEDVEIVQSNWEYLLNITKLTNGSHNISFQCSDGKYYSEITKISFNITESSANEPNVTIEYPQDDISVSGWINISGTAEGGNRKIQHVELQINETEYIIKNVTNKWFYNCNTSLFTNGSYQITAICYTNENQSKIVSVNITIDNPIQNDGEPLDKVVIADSGGFQISFLPLSEKIIPGEDYKIKVYHKKEPKYSFPQLTYLQIKNLPQGLNVTIPISTLITPADGIGRYVEISIKINNQIDKNSKITFQMTCPTNYIIVNTIEVWDWLERFRDFRVLQLGDLLTDDIWFETGDW